MKSYMMRVDGVCVVVKVYMRVDSSSPDGAANERADRELLTAEAVKLTHLFKTLSPSKYPFLLPYQMWIKSASRLGRTTAPPVYLHFSASTSPPTSTTACRRAPS